MKKIVIHTLLASASMACALSASAQESTQPASAFKMPETVLAYGSVGSQGLGVGLGVALGEKSSLRAELSTASYSFDKTESDIRYKGDLDVKGISLLADYFPFGGKFRLTGGVNFGKAGASFKGETTGGGLININGTDYPVAPGEGINATLDFPKPRPYLGIGWGLGQLSQKGFRFGVDIGAEIGKAKGDLTATQGLQALPGFNADFEKERQSYRDGISGIGFYPVVKLSIGYAF